MLLGGGGVVVFDTVTVTLVALPTFPAASKARAPNVWLPFAIVVVLNAIEYGRACVAPERHSVAEELDAVTPTLSVALADAVDGACDRRAVRRRRHDAVGAVVSVQGRVETMTAVLGELLPEASKASTARV